MVRVRLAPVRDVKPPTSLPQLTTKSATPKKPPAKVATPRKRKVKAEDEDDGAAAESTPSPKKRKVSGQEVAEEGGRKG